MVPALLGRELRARLFGDPVSEHRGLAFELARFVVGRDEVGDFAGGVCCLAWLLARSRAGEDERSTAMVRAGRTGLKWEIRRKSCWGLKRENMKRKGMKEVSSRKLYSSDDVCLRTIA